MFADLYRGSGSTISGPANPSRRGKIFVPEAGLRMP
jgi:hypothetical protein